MKKISLLVCAVFATVTLFAGTAVQRQAEKVNFNVNVSKGTMEVQEPLALERTDASFNLVKKATAAVETDTMLALYRTPYQFTTGVPTGGGVGYDYGATIILPFTDSVLYYDAYKAYGLQPAWEIPGGAAITDTPYIRVPAGVHGGSFALPTLSYGLNPVPTSDTTQTYFAPYTFGDLFSGDEKDAMVAPDFLDVTQAGYYTEYPGGKFADGWGWWNIWGNAAIGDYKYGTKMKNPWYQDTTVYFDSIISVISNNALMYIEQINVAVWTASDDDTFFPDSANDVITMSIVPLTKEGAIDWEHPYGTTTAGKADYTDCGNGWLGMLTFTFYTEDPLTHLPTFTPIIVDGSFVVVFSGLSKNTTDLGFCSDRHQYFPDAPEAATYFVDYSTGKRSFQPLWASPDNILITFSSSWPDIQGLPAEIAVPLEGGTKSFSIPTNIHAEWLEIDYDDDWIEIEVESETYVESGKTKFAYADAVTITIDEADEGREDVIEIDALGRIYTVKVVQGGGSTGIQSVKKVNDGKLYNVLGMEVDENYKGVVIRNGEKFLQ